MQVTGGERSRIQNHCLTFEVPLSWGISRRLEYLRAELLAAVMKKDGIEFKEAVKRLA